MRGCSSHHVCILPSAPPPVLSLVLASIACDASLPLALVLDHLSLPRATNTYVTCQEAASRHDPFLSPNKGRLKWAKGNVGTFSGTIHSLSLNSSFIACR